jgi:DNA-binding NarL/FixJ family response regulator
MSMSASVLRERGESRRVSLDEHDGSVEVEVLVIDDHLAIRRGVELLLRSEGLRVAGVAGGLGQARELLQRRRHDVALIDLHLGEDCSTGLVQETLARDPNAAIVLYTGFTDAAGLAAAVHAGTRGFVLKSSPACTLIAALRAVAAGGTFVDPDLAPLLSGGGDHSIVDDLSPREHEVLLLLAGGLARQLFLSPETVRTHVRNAMAKLGARTRVQAVAMVMRAGG